MTDVLMLKRQPEIHNMKYFTSNLIIVSLEWKHLFQIHILITLLLHIYSRIWYCSYNSAAVDWVVKQVQVYKVGLGVKGSFKGHFQEKLVKPKAETQWLYGLAESRQSHDSRPGINSTLWFDHFPFWGKPWGLVK